MKILLTGTSGFVGRELVKRMHNTYELVLLLRHSSNTKELEKLPCKIIKFHNYEDIAEIFIDNSFDGVIHLASNIVVEHKPSDIEGLINSNLTFGTYLLEASKQNNVQWFINTGTFWQNYQNDAYNPVNLYAASKEAFETIAKYYTETSNLIFVTIKLNDTFGPNDTRPKVFNLWNNLTKSGETLQMSKGEQIIDISYIEDIINSYLLLIAHLNSKQAKTFKNKTFVVSNGEKCNLRNLAVLFEKIAGCKLNINWGGREYRQREVMEPYSQGTCVPGWEQKYTLEESIENTLMEMNND